MIVNETLVARHRETGSAPFSLLPGDCGLAVTLPDGSTAAGTSLAVAPSTSSITQDVTADFSGGLGGAYGLVWSINVGDSRLLRPETYFACWTDVYTQVRQLMRSTPVVVTDYDVDITLVQTMAELLSVGVFGGVLTSYNGVPVADRGVFDRALALLVAAWLAPFTMKQAPSGDVIAFTSGTEEYKWAPGVKRADGKTREELWVDKAWELLATTTVLGQSARAFENVNVGFVASGRRRSQPTVLIPGPMGQLVVNPLTMLWRDWYDGYGLPWSWCGKP